MAKRAKKVQQAHTYESRIILFLDFLGFKEIIESTVGNNGRLQSLLKAIDRLYDIGREEADLNKTRSITTFSDSVVISYAVHEQSAVYYLLSDIAFAVIDLAIQGYLVRGAVTKGELIHTKRYLLGPAMVKAYEMESKLAKHPRVLIDPKLVAIARKAPADQNGPHYEERFVREMMTKDEDGHYYFDYISWQSVVQTMDMDGENYPLYLRDIALILERGLAKTDPGVLAKYLWIHRQYVAAIDKFVKLSPRSKHRRNNPELFDAIEELPKMMEEAKAAMRVVTGKRASSG